MVEQGKRGYPGKMCVVAHRRKLSVGCGLAIYSGRARANSSVTKHLSSVTSLNPAGMASRAAAVGAMNNFQAEIRSVGDEESLAEIDLSIDNAAF